MHERQPPLLERTGRARYAGPTFVVDFARLLELLHDAPDKDQRSRRGVRQEEWEMLAGTSRHRGQLEGGG